MGRRVRNRIQLITARGLLTALLWLLLPITAATQSTQSIRGLVVDAEDGRPLVGASVSVVATSYATIADQSGRFRIEHLPPGQYELTVSMLGYERVVIPVQAAAGVTRRLDIGLRRSPFPVEGIRVTARREAFAGGTVTIIERNEFKNLRPLDLADILESVEGIHVQRSGQASGEVHVSIRGSDAKHVLVMVDGQKLNAASDGVANLNTIPVDMIERVEVHRGGSSSRFGPGALAGAVNVVTHPRALSGTASAGVSRDMGSFNTGAVRFSAVNPVHTAEFVSRLAVDTRESDGDFGFHYSVAPADVEYRGVRVNNESSARNYFASGLWKPNDRTGLSFSAHVLESRAGLPGPASDQNPYAHKQDDRVAVTLKADRQLTESIRFENAVGYSQYEQYFCDRQSAALEQFETKYVDELATERLDVIACIGDDQVVRAGGELQWERLLHTDLLREAQSLGTTRRSMRSAFGSISQQIDLSRTKLLDVITIDAAVRYDHTETSPDDPEPAYPWDPLREDSQIEAWSPQIGAVVAAGTRVRLTLRGSHGKSLRLPSINALFWKGDARSQGNPDLRPERSLHTEGGAEIGCMGTWYGLSAGITFFHDDVTDLVQWTQGYQGVWSPINLGKARITGHEDYIRLLLKGRLLELSYQNTVTNAINKVPGHNSYGKSLTHAPHFVTSLSARLNWRGAFMSYTVRRVDKRYALEGNEKWYEAHRVDDFETGFEASLARRWRIHSRLRVANIRDEDYVLITQYPMPGSEHTVSLGLSYTIDE